MTNRNFILETKEFLQEHYNYPERVFEIKASVATEEGSLTVDLLIRKPDGGPYCIIMTNETAKSREDLIEELKDILTQAKDVKCAVYRYKTDEDLADFLGFRKEVNKLTGKVELITLDDYPYLEKSWSKAIWDLISGI